MKPNEHTILVSREGEPNRPESRSWAKMMLILLVTVAVVGALYVNNTAEKNRPGQSTAIMTTETRSRPSRICRKTDFKRLVGDITSFLRGPGGVDQFNHPINPKYVRLIFHDCVGGCDGCIDFDNPANAGLEFSAKKLEPIVKAYQHLVSRADIWALVGTISALEASRAQVESPSKHIPKFRVYFGRKDCNPKGHLPTRKFPSASGGLVETLAYFRKEFGFNAADVTALMGAHNLGGARPKHSGYWGTWKKIPRELDRLNNEFYKELVETDVEDWQQEVNGQWNLRELLRDDHCDNKKVLTPSHNFGTPHMFLNADMSLYRHLKPSPEDAQPTMGPLANRTLGVDAGYKCHWNIRECPLQRPSQARIIERFANNNRRFMNAFADVYGRMMIHGSSKRNLYLLTHDLQTV